MAYVGPSVTPYYDLNPGYRIYYIDGDHKSTTRVSASENEGIHVNCMDILFSVNSTAHIETSLRNVPLHQFVAGYIIQELICPLLLQL